LVCPGRTTLGPLEKIKHLSREGGHGIRLVDHGDLQLGLRPFERFSATICSFFAATIAAFLAATKKVISPKSRRGVQFRA